MEIRSISLWGLLVTFCCCTEYSLTKPAVVTRCSETQPCPKNYVCEYGQKCIPVTNKTSQGKEKSVRKRSYHEEMDYNGDYYNDDGIYPPENYGYKSASNQDYVDTHGYNKRFKKKDHRDSFNEWLKLAQDGKLGKDMNHPFYFDLYRLQMSKHSPTPLPNQLDGKEDPRSSAIGAIKRRLQQVEAMKRLLIQKMKKLEYMKAQEEKVMANSDSNLQSHNRWGHHPEIHVPKFKPLPDFEDDLSSDN